MTTPSPARRTTPCAAAFALAALLLLAQCATVRAPSGGPVDTDPPEVLESYPPNGTTRFADDHVSFHWNEHVDRQSFEQSVRVSPLAGGALVFDWSGRSVDVIFPDTLLRERTYVVTVGTKVKDVHAGNAMKRSFQLAFSTGDSLDRAGFGGRVFDAHPSGISIFAYLLRDRDPDTLDPSRTRPDFAVQTGDDGTFEFRNLPEGPFRAFAVRDKQNNDLYDRESDDIGVAQNDLRLARNDSAGLALRYLLTSEDTTAPYLQSVEAADRRTVQLTFSEALRDSALSTARIAIADSASGRRIEPLCLFFPGGKQSRIDLVTDAPLENRKYLITVDSVSDETGNPIRPGPPAAFEGSETPDTLRPRLVLSYPADKSADVDPDSSFLLVFTRPMHGAPGLSLADSARNTAPPVPVRLAANMFRVDHPGLKDGMRYRLCIDGRSTTDSLAGLPISDSSLCITFTTAFASSFGEIAGTIVDTVSLSAVKVVRARNTERANVALRTDARGNAFVFARVPAGKYVLDAFVDRDENGKYDHGSASPYTPSERFAIVADTVRVRARWTTETKIFIP